MDIIYSIKSIIISGIVLGSLYSIMASGLGLLWGTLRIYNVAYGSLIMLGAIIAWSANLVGGLLFAIIISSIILFFIGMLMEKILVEPFFDKPNSLLVIVITTLAAMLFIDNLAQIIWGVRLKQLPVLAEGSVRIFGAVISIQELFIVLFAPVVCISFSFFLKKSKIGLAIRAVEQNLDFALLVGINVYNIYAVTFGISAVLATITGILLGSIRFVVPSMGEGYILKAFIIVILGGIGSMSGTLFAAYFIGIVESITTYYFGLYVTPAVLFLTLIVVLIFKPTGISGGK